ncbi:MAG: tRNA nucleotidyltransferase, partial [Proteobacteria bacterium]|nr:tRNA nucleotidyltransferase [Pseudomonadota bacterium]
DLPTSRALDVSQRLKAPNAFTLLAEKVSDWRPQIKSALTDAEKCMALLKALDALRRAEPFEGFCETVAALEQNSTEALEAVSRLRRARTAAQSVTAADFTRDDLEGPALGAAIRAAQIEQITSLLT